MRALKILLVDNYDSFTFNLYQQLLTAPSNASRIIVDVVRNDRLDFSLCSDYDAFVLSPGPGRPETAGQMPELVSRFFSTHPILGICLGHQALIAHFGGSIVHAPIAMHGKTSIICHSSAGLFTRAPSSMSVMRYHSLVADSSTLPCCFQINAATADGVVMAVQHKTLPLYGLQFHPESFLTSDGSILISNFLNLCIETYHEQSLGAWR